MVAALAAKVQAFDEGDFVQTCEELSADEIDLPGAGWLGAVKTLRNERHQDSPEAGTAAAPSANLFVVSNRLPLSVKQTEEGLEFNMSSGGLVSAMLGVMEDESMTWIGWPGISVDSESDRDKITSQLAEDRCVPVFLDETTQDQYYNGFCNSVIWPLFHYVQDVLDTSPLQEQWDAYV